MTQISLPGLLQERANQQPDATAYTFIDYDADPAGFAESITWSQVHRRACNVAAELTLHGSVGDRAAILLPEGLDYIVALMGALQAGFIAVPLPAPQFRAQDERIFSALRDCTPSVILTASSVVDQVAKYAHTESELSQSSVIEIDSLDLDFPGELDPMGDSQWPTAYLQYTSGSTREPSGVIVSHQNVIANLRQAASVYFEECGNVPPPELSLVSWLPFHHDMGLFFTIFTSMPAGTPTTFMSPMSFLQRPARWMQLLGQSGLCYSCAPNFAFDLAARRTSDDDMAGLDLAAVMAISSGSERVHPATIRRFNERFARFNLKDTAIRPSYGLAEATLWVAAPRMGRPAATVRFDNEHLSRGQAKPCSDGAGGGNELVSYGSPRICTVRIVNPETRTENPPGAIGEIWVHGDNVSIGYWQKPVETVHTFRARIVDPSSDTPEGFWLRTGDLGVMVDGELFIMGRIKDVLIVDGRNHYPDDIEATIREITGGRVAAIAISDERREQLVAVVELDMRGGSDDERMQKFRPIKREIISAISDAHGLRIADVVLVAPGAIPITTSGKVRRSACVEHYRKDEFKRLDVSAELLAESW